MSATPVLAEMELRSAAGAIAIALLIIEPHRDLLRRFEVEARDLESFGPVLAPALFLKSQRETWRADIRAIFAAAEAFCAEAGEHRQALLDAHQLEAGHGR